MNLTTRQHREREYHCDHALLCREKGASVDLNVITSNQRRWWNGYWTMYTLLRRYPGAGKSALVVGCGQGDDARLLTRLGYRVTAFDLSPDMIGLARDLADREGLTIDFQVTSAEQPSLHGHTFDLILARDILHHVEVGKALAALSHMANPGSMVMINENYTHSLIQKIRESRWVCEFFYPRLVSFIYKNEKPYITEDEVKLNEHDLAACRAMLAQSQTLFFNMFVTRIVPDSYPMLARLDRLLLMMFKPLGFWFAGRFILFGTMKKIS
ncbi:MAG: class I SAM-dependent methyltransferase [Magnetococcales bacterium]|nr:class I SAM-dependent methyltransferase [Magnetococcales bacterium]MBF0148877.1 class I SAM-dependent methyltransferase [Magnetococcales bacterium]